jgi:phosphoribosylformylglycinamidine (FGAM) synthase-like enzyme
MWNEHCSYKSSKKWLRTLPTEGPQVICGPGENAGVVDIGDGQAVVFKMESHNHPSYIEPYQGAATGVGGILRDVFTMGARPIAAMNALSFGEKDHPKTRQLVHGVVEGIGGYGNCFGVPTIGGEVRFHPAYNGNCLVNAFAAGLVRRQDLLLRRLRRRHAGGLSRRQDRARRRRRRDHGLGRIRRHDRGKAPHGAGRRPVHRKAPAGGLPRTDGHGCRDLDPGHGRRGPDLFGGGDGRQGRPWHPADLDHVPQREDAMTAYEMMLSESQERMLMVLRPEKEAEARAVFEKWDLDFAIVGETIPRTASSLCTATKRWPICRCPSCLRGAGIRPALGRDPPRPRDGPVPEVDPIDALKALIASPNYCSRAWIYEQYDTGHGRHGAHARRSGAGIVRVHGTDKALAFTSDVTPRYVRANPVEGGKQAVAEAFRNLCAVGAKPLATTDNLNFGNPEKPEIMGQFVGAIKGHRRGLRGARHADRVGQCRLYNETDGQAILPTPTIGAVGLLDSLDEMIADTIRDGHVLLLVGETAGHLGQSALLWEVFNREDGDAPHVDLEAERRNGDFIRDNARVDQRLHRPQRRRPCAGGLRDGRGGGRGRHARRRRHRRRFSARIRAAT